MDDMEPVYLDLCSRGWLWKSETTHDRRTVFGVRRSCPTVPSNLYAFLFFSGVADTELQGSRGSFLRLFRRSIEGVSERYPAYIYHSNEVMGIRVETNHNVLGSDLIHAILTLFF